MKFKLRYLQYLSFRLSDLLIILRSHLFVLVACSTGNIQFHYFLGSCLLGGMSYNFVGDVYDRTTPIEMTQVNPEPALPSKPIDGLQVPETEDFSHISFHQVKKSIYVNCYFFCSCYESFNVFLFCRIYYSMRQSRVGRLPFAT